MGFSIQAPEVTLGLTLPQRLLLAVGYGVAVSWALKAVGPLVPAGVGRLLLVSPIILLNWTVPLMFDLGPSENFTRSMLSFSLSWLGSSKVLGFALNRGPLADLRHIRLREVVAQLMLPIYPQEERHADDKARRGRMGDSISLRGLLAGAAATHFALLGLVWVLVNGDLPRIPRHVLTGFVLYQYVNIVMALAGLVATALLGVPVLPPFDKPFLSESLADWWGRRWNIPTAASLRVFIYEPICEGRWVRPDADAHSNGPKAPPSSPVQSPLAALPVPGLDEPVPPVPPAPASPSPATTLPPPANGRPSQLRRGLALLAVFFASGVLHEVMVWYMHTQGKVGWKMTAFFTLQAPLMLAEQALKRWWRRRGLPPPNRWLSRLLTLSLLELLGYFTFMAVLDEEPGRTLFEGNLRVFLASNLRLGGRLLQALLGPSLAAPV